MVSDHLYGRVDKCLPFEGGSLESFQVTFVDFVLTETLTSLGRRTIRS